MSLRNVWNDDQRSRLVAQLHSTSRAFAAALPAEDAIDGLIMNLHLCLALDLEPQAVQDVFGQRTLAFVLGMMAASQTDSVAPRYSVDLACDLSGRRQFVETRIGMVGTDGRLHIDQGEMNGRNDGTIHLVFRSRACGRRN